MKRLCFQVIVAVFTFVVGAEFHQLVIRLTDVALRYNTVCFEEPASFPADLSAAEEIFFDRNVMVISMGAKRDLYLGKKFVGTSDDTRELEAKLKYEFALNEQELTDLEPKELRRKIRITRDYRLVYIKASVGASYGDVVHVVEAARRAGAQHIGLVADRRKKGTG